MIEGTLRLTFIRSIGLIHWDLERWKVKLIDFNGLDEEMEDVGFGFGIWQIIGI